MNNIRVNLLGLVLLLFTVTCQAKHSEIHCAIKHGNLDDVTELISNDKSLLFTKDDFMPGSDYEVLNRSLLHLAIYYSEHEILEYLLEMFTSHNINIDKLLDSKGRNPLFYAVNQADPDALKLLIKFNVDLINKDDEGCNILEGAVWGHGSTKKVLKCCNILIKEGVRHNFSNYDLDCLFKYEDLEIVKIAKKGMSLPAKVGYALWRMIR